MNKRQLYESIMRNVSREVKKVLNEDYSVHTPRHIIRDDERKAYWKLKDVIEQTILLDEDDILEASLIDTVNNEYDDEIDSYVEDITIKQFLESILNRRSIDIADTTARNEALAVTARIINKIMPNACTNNELAKAYYFGY